ncbi:MAG TPA: hypothetical protein PLU72_04360 [Candidatus Ozemobacteraceae bacterium]|nr:hypothetical protein [Candidatus Ozemobacteraceae bacterium]HQG27192.1 hypothetical protein [Candidatus Ozemobacteraceae bacterium]
MTRTDRRGSVFLMALTALTVLFILGFSITYFTGSEDFSSAVSYESEVAFNLAESAVEEFVARLKHSLNNDDNNNQLYKVLRARNTKVEDEIPLDAAQVARLTTYTRETAKQIYGISIDRGFLVDAKIILKHINGVEAKSGNKTLYNLKKEEKEKQGELTVNAKVIYRGKSARVTLTFLIRVVKTFVPPFNYFTLFVKDGTVFGDSFFNNSPSDIGAQPKNLRLDHGWRSLPGQEKFDAVDNVSYWENALAINGYEAQVPPGRVYLGQDPTANMPPSIILQSTNGTKLLTEMKSDAGDSRRPLNAQENLFLKFDVIPSAEGGEWVGMKDYVKKYMELQGQEKTKDGVLGLWTGWSNDTRVRLINVGADKILTDTKETLGEPTFGNAMISFNNYRNQRLKAATSPNERLLLERLYPEPANSGLDLFGTAELEGKPASPKDGRINTRNISPTLVYGQVWRMYYRIVSIMTKKNKRLELPFINIDPGSDGSPPPIPIPPEIKPGTNLTATQALTLFTMFGVPKDHAQALYDNWDDIPDGLKEMKKYQKFMSDAGVEPYNAGLGNMIQRIAGKQEIYAGPLAKHLVPFLANEPYPGMSSDLSSIVSQSPVRQYFEGDLWHAIPDPSEAYLLDFYFIPRSTEDFFRGRTTISIGGTVYDRFHFKYINDVRQYLAGAKGQALELNGILALNDSEELKLNNLKFRGHGVIYSSPMMGGGPVVILGDFYPAAAGGGATSIDANPERDMMTIVAPRIVIDTSTAANDPCYIEANLISVSEPIVVSGSKSVRIRGQVVTPSLNLDNAFRTPGTNVIEYNPLNSIWRKDRPTLMDEMFVAKIVTGGVGKFDWKYEHD